MRIAFIIAPALLAGCATSPERQAEYAATQASRVPDATPDGAPVSCIQTSLIRQSHVRNDSVIDFAMAGGKLYRNTLPQSCPGLGFEDHFGYRTRTGQLCLVDTITVLRPDISGPSCGLGTFQPVKLVQN